MSRFLTALSVVAVTLSGPVSASKLIEIKSKTHWAFQPISNPAPPQTGSDWPEQPLDHFILKQLVDQGLSPSPRADRRTLIRRAYITLTGLNPSREQTEAFVNDPSPDAFAKVVDSLLASPQYGERWARHWLDVARYADTKGYVFEEARQYPYAYTFRDWVIRSLNEDMPYDQFLNYQIAADQIATGDEDKKHLAAMGFLTVGRRFLNRQPDIIDDRIDVVTRGTMALTVACSRCHDHKYDPIPTADYYSLYGVFASSQEPKPLPLLGAQPETEQTNQFERILREKEAKVDKHLKKRLDDQRKEEQLKKYLIAVRDGQGKNNAELKKLASDRGLVQAFLLRWRDFINSKAPDDPIFAAWKACFDLPQERFAAEAPARLAPILQANLTNPRVALALKDKKLGNLGDLAAAYAKLFAHDDAEQPHDKPAREQIRQVLYAKGTPNDVPLDQLYRELPTPDQQHVRRLRREVEKHKTEHPGAPPRGMVMTDRAKPVEPYVFVRGQQGNRGPKVPRQFPAIAAGETRKPFPAGTSGRLEMARHITSPDNPLTARVIVNRVWLQHFGNGLVDTPSDFGLRSDPPSHPQLLDFLASRFVREGWSLKKLHRHLLLSATYQQSSSHHPDKAAIDPENRMLWRANRQRLDFEAMRDSLLQASGELDQRMFGRPYQIAKRPFTTRRTIYSQVERQNLENVFRTFDFASPDAHCPERHQTTVPQQALFMMNSPFMEHLAGKLAGALTGGTTDDKIYYLYRKIFSRDPQPEEISLGKQFIAAASESDDKLSPWSYGFGSFKDGHLSFRPFETFTGTAFQSGPDLPAKVAGWASLNQRGGHPGHGTEFNVIARFTAPEAGSYHIETPVELPSDKSDGLLAIIVADGQRELVRTTIPKKSKRPLKAGPVHLEEGATIDLVIACGGNESFDSFRWNPIIKSTHETWSYTDHFAPDRPKQDPWQQYAQALLSTNEFAFVD